MNRPISPPSLPVDPDWPHVSAKEIAYIETLKIQDDTPVDNLFAEKQQRLLVEPLYLSWQPTIGEPPRRRQFMAMANVGLFYEKYKPPLVPDNMLSLDVRSGRDRSKKINLSYYVWIYQKPPDVVIEIVSDRRGGEASRKKQIYRQIRVPYYVIFDPDQKLRNKVLRGFALQEGKYQPINLDWLPGVGMGLILWEGVYEEDKDLWLRWCDKNGNVIPTGTESVAHQQLNTEAERRRANDERQRADRLEQKLREAGIELDDR